MIEYSKVKVGDKFKIVGQGAPGFANLGDIVTATKVGDRRVDVVHDGHGREAYFALTCGAMRLEPVQQDEADQCDCEPQNDVNTDVALGQNSRPDVFS